MKAERKVKLRKIERQKKAKQNYHLKRIEKKYDVIIGETIELYKDKTMGELWAALDIIKDKMRKELKEAGIE